MVDPQQAERPCGSWQGKHLQNVTPNISLNTQEAKEEVTRKHTDNNH